MSSTPITRDSEVMYSKRELDSKFSEIIETLGRIEAQTTKHNGRLKKGEENWAFTKGALSILTLLVLPILAWAIYVLVNIDTRIHEAIIDAATDYVQDSRPQ